MSSLCTTRRWVLKVYADDIACRYELLSSRLCCFPEWRWTKKCAILLLKSGLGVSWDKFLVVASHLKLAKRFAKFWTERGGEGFSRGCVFGRGPERWAAWYQSQTEARLKLLTCRAKRVKPSRIMSGGALASMRYGVSVVGLSDARLALVRNRAAFALRRKRMNSVTMSLMLVNAKRFDSDF